MPAVGSNAFVSPIIQPITDADRLLQALTLEQSVVIADAAARFVIFTVPKDERWTLMFLRSRRSSGTWTMDEFSTVNPAGLRMTIHTAASTAASILWELNKNLELDEGWQLELDVDTHSVNGNISSDVLVLKQDAF